MRKLALMILISSLPVIASAGFTQPNAVSQSPSAHHLLLAQDDMNSGSNSNSMDSNQSDSNSMDSNSNDSNSNSNSSDSNSMDSGSSDSGSYSGANDTGN